jgi:O-antigen ligase
MKTETTFHRAAVLTVVILPFFLFYGRGISDILVCLTDLLFLAHCLRTRSWRWTRRLWVPLAGLLWLIQLIAAIHLGPAKNIAESALMVRLLLYVAALEDWVLTGAWARKALWAVFAGLAGWTVLECWQQFLFHTNINGFPRWPDGSLTGPFYKPRAGEVFLFVALPGLLPIVLRAINHKTRAVWAAGLGLLLFTVATMILIGQRMPNALFLLGLCVAGLMVKRFRAPLLVAVALGVAAIAALPVISPPTFGKLVLETSRQISHFAESPYGQLYTRASVMIADRPWTGFGFEGFKDYCGLPEYFHGWPAYGIPDASNGGLRGCNLHPHNYYLQIGTMAGLPGLAAFIAMALLWLGKIGRRLRPSAEPIQTMVFATCVVIFWPIASTSALFTFDTAGWVLLLTGWGLAAGK